MQLAPELRILEQPHDTPGHSLLGTCGTSGNTPKYSQYSLTFFKHFSEALFPFMLLHSDSVHLD